MRTYRANVNEVRGQSPQPKPELSAKELLFKLENQYSYFRDDMEAFGRRDGDKEIIAKFKMDIQAARIEAAKQGETK